MNPPISLAEVPPIDCRTAVERLWDFLDEELDAHRMAEVEAHVALCASCAEHYRFARAFLDAITESWQALPDTMQLRERVVGALTRQGFRDAGRPDPRASD